MTDQTPRKRAPRKPRPPRRTHDLPEGQMREIVGVRADFNGDCRRCPDGIVHNDRVVHTASGWIHARCASGQDE